VVCGLHLRDKAEARGTTKRVSFDINENTVAVSRIDLPSTVDKVADWNRRYLMPELYSIRTDFGRLARRYERVRSAIIEKLN